MIIAVWIEFIDVIKTFRNLVISLHIFLAPLFRFAYKLYKS